MRLSVVVLSYNHEGLTQKCVDSVIQKIGHESDIYLVHNGSSKKVLDLLTAKYPSVEHLIVEENKQFAGGANIGLAQAFDDGADAVLFLSNDTRVKIFDSAQIDKYFDGAKAFLLAPKIERRETGQIDSYGASVSLSRGRLEHLKEREQMSERFYVPGSGFLLSREAWEKVGGFDETLGSYWEDVDLSLRARRAGVRLGTIPEVELRHGVGKTCHNDPLYTVYYFHRNRRIVSWRHGSNNERLQFFGVYARDTLGKSFKLLKNKDFLRLKHLLKSLIS